MLTQHCCQPHCCTFQMQSLHADTALLPISSLYFPDAQSLHADSRTASEVAHHCTFQMHSPCMLIQHCCHHVYFPDAQSLHALSPSSLLYFPDAQSLHTDSALLPASLLYFPDASLACAQSQLIVVLPRCTVLACACANHCCTFQMHSPCMLSSQSHCCTFQMHSPCMQIQHCCQPHCCTYQLCILCRCSTLEANTSLPRNMLWVQ